MYVLNYVGVLLNLSIFLAYKRLEIVDLGCEAYHTSGKVLGVVIIRGEGSQEVARVGVKVRVGGKLPLGDEVKFLH